MYSGDETDRMEFTCIGCKNIQTCILGLGAIVIFNKRNIGGELWGIAILDPGSLMGKDVRCKYLQCQCSMSSFSYQISITATH